MKLDPERVQALAGETGFRPTAVEKVLRLGALAADLSRHPYLSKVPALKGGAALNLCFGAPQRRALPRDLFDMSLLPEIAKEVWQTERLRRILIAISVILDHPLTRYGRDRFERVTDKTIEQQLGPMLTREAPDAADLKSRVWSIVEPFLELRPEEREYVELMQRGELRPELLFPADEEMADRLRRHPALQWKASNARQYRSSSGP